jgi:NADH-quinone oxidoreductase subunit G
MALVQNPFNHDAPPADTPLVNVLVDGVWHNMPKGLNVVEAVERAGGFLPHYCYHPKLSVVGNCRMCLFEMGMPKTDAERKPILNDCGLPVDHLWIPKPAIGCATQITEGMGIRTQSPLAVECRQGVMEFLLINHPLDCPICDQAGECKLQEYSVEYGHAGSRFVEEKVHKPKRVDIGERIVLDDERCIMCSRCVRFAGEIAQDDCLGFSDHGSHTTLTIHPDKPFNSDYSLNTVDICPVGALTSKDFRFKMRVWFLRETKSICTTCSTGCNVIVGSRESTVYRLTPRENEDVNSHWMCDQGRLGFHYLHDERRLLQPTARVGGSAFKTSWNDVIGQIGDRLKHFRNEQVAILASARMTNEELFLVRELRAALGGDSVLCDIVPRPVPGDNFLKSPDANPNTQGAELMGLSMGGKDIARMAEAIEGGKVKAMLVFHEDAVAAGIPEAALRKLDLLIVQTLLPSPATGLAHFVLPGAAFAEKRGSMVNFQGRLQRLNKAVPHPGQAMDDFEVLLKIRLAGTGGNGIHSVEDVFKAMSEKIPAFANLSLSKIGDLGIGGIGQNRVPEGWGALRLASPAPAATPA